MWAQIIIKLAATVVVVHGLGGAADADADVVDDVTLEHIYSFITAAGLDKCGWGALTAILQGILSC